jgi:hypothetical protein
MRAIPKTWQEAEKQGYEFDGEESTISRDGRTRRGKSFMVLRGSPKPHPDGYTIEGETLDYLEVPFTARVLLGRPRRIHLKSAQPAHSGGVATA